MSCSWCRGPSLSSLSHIGASPATGPLILQCGLLSGYLDSSTFRAVLLLPQGLWADVGGGNLTRNGGDKPLQHFLLPVRPCQTGGWVATWKRPPSAHPLTPRCWPTGVPGTALRDRPRTPSLPPSVPVAYLPGACCVQAPSCVLGHRCEHSALMELLPSGGTQVTMKIGK